MSNLVSLNNDNFEAEVLSSETPVLVDFYADWCGPCKVIGPTVEELAQDYEGRARVAKVDIDANPELAGQYGIRSIPTLMVFKDGEVRDVVRGAVPKSQLAAVLDQYAA